MSVVVTRGTVGMSGGMVEFVPTSPWPGRTVATDRTGPLRLTSPLRADVWSCVEATTVLVDLPGVAEEDVTVTVVEDQVRVDVAARPVALPEGASRRVAERSHPSGSRTFAAACAVDGERVTATLAAGVLTVTLPHAERARPRTIAVTTAE